jgi:16S rRNA (uracil1498-N3)-methyltransferase
MRVCNCLTPGPLAAPGVLELSPGESAHLVRVRRARTGDAVKLFDGAGAIATGVVESADAKAARVRVDTIERAPESQRPRAELALALTRGGDLDDCLHRAIELGMAAFRPITTAHSVVRPGEGRADARVERWQRLAEERLKQCERAWLPAIHAPVELPALLTTLSQEGVAAVALVERAADATPLPAVLDAIGAGRLCVIVGPEGGWDADERALFAAAPGVHRASLGAAILRSETAALAALSTILAHGLSAG